MKFGSENGSILMVKNNEIRYTLRLFSHLVWLSSEPFNSRFRYTRVYTSDSINELTSDITSEYTSGYTSEYTSEYISEYISEYNRYKHK